MVGYVVKLFNNYGFVAPNLTDRGVFFHARELDGDLDDLMVGDLLSYETKRVGDRYEATGVTVLEKIQRYDGIVEQVEPNNGNRYGCLKSGDLSLRFEERDCSFHLHKSHLGREVLFTVSGESELKVLGHPREAVIASVLAAEDELSP